MVIKLSMGGRWRGGDHGRGGAASRTPPPKMFTGSNYQI